MNHIASEEHFADLGDSRLFYRLAGTPGALPDFVLEHGGAGSADHWSELAPLLAAHARVLSYDRAGMGQSRADGRGYEAQAVNERLARLLEHAGIRKPFILVGYSLGGLYSRHYAQAHAQDLAGLVLLDASPTGMQIPPDAHRRLMRMLRWLHWLARLGLGGLYLRLMGQRSDSAKARRGVRRFAERDFLACMSAEFLAIPLIQAEVERLAATPVHPTLAVLAGTAPAGMPADVFAGLRRMQDRLAQAAPAPLSRQVVIDDAHHGNILSDAGHAAQVADHLLAFARSLDQGHAA
ncbi:MAG TPA: alpha/beta hydrolase [Fontimonas sp.]